ncbi:hypothetical protein ATANTOWER_021205, partial [Ataeniobius toweri]|nr:hypothetical protein [Ataeniobius toweri]
HPHTTARVAPHRTTTTAHHTAEDRTQQRASKAKLCKKPTLRKCAHTSLPKIMPPYQKTPIASKPKNICPTPIHQPEVAPLENPHQSLQKAEPTEPKPRPAENIHPENNSDQSTCPNHADPSDQFSQTESELRTIRNRNQDK